MHLLSAADLAIFRGERLVIKGLSFTIGSGGVLILRGQNGAGKSTLLRACAGLTPLAAGRLSWNGADALADLCAHADRLAWLGHQDAVKPALTVAEHVSSGAALAAMGLAGFAALPARLLSAGQKRRLALARVFSSGRSLLLLDEPTTGLDAASLARFVTACEAHRAAGGMIIASTHLPLGLRDERELTL